MTALSITVTQVMPGSAATDQFTNGLAGAAITAGQAVYYDTATETWKLADANDTAATAAAGGIALNGAASGQPVRVQTAGSVTLGAAAAMTVGEVYCVSIAAGSIVPVADLLTTNRVTILGVASTAAILQLRINNTQIAKA
jgi:hypothetical protein